MAQISKAVLITGCSTGIGRATAGHLARAGQRVYATARRIESIQDLKAAGARTLALDVSDEESMRAAVTAVEEAEGAVGALVNNAGYSQSGALETIPLDDVRRQFETNVFGLLRMCQLVLPGMRHQGYGRIVNMSSMGGKLTFPGGGVYHATKHAVEAISDALRFEVKGFGVDVSVIEPGLIKTNFAETAAGSVARDAGPYSEFNGAVSAATAGVYEGPLGRLGGGPETVARAIERALTAKRPRTRYPVTLSARVLLAQRALLPDRAWDAVVGTSFPAHRLWSVAYFKDADEVYATIGKLFRELAEDDELAPKFNKANTIVQYQYRDPESRITVKLLEGEEGQVDCGETTMEPEIVMTMDADTAHRFWLGKVNVTVALARAQMKAKGPVAKILKLVPLAKPVFPRYRRQLEEAGRQDLLEVS